MKRALARKARRATTVLELSYSVTESWMDEVENFPDGSVFLYS